MKKIFLVLTLLLLLLPACSYEKDYIVETSEVSTTLIHNPLREAGTLTLNSGYDKDSVYHLQYPTFNSPSIDKAIKGFLEELKEEFYSYIPADSKGSNELHMEYQSRLKGDYVSLEFSIFMDINGLAHPINEVRVFTLKPEEDKVVTLEESATEKEIKRIQEVVFKKTQPQDDEEEPFVELDLIPINNFSYDGSTLSLFFNPSEIRPSNEGVQRVDITGEEIIKAFTVPQEEASTETKEIAAIPDEPPVETPEPEPVPEPAPEPEPIDPYYPERELDPSRPAIALTFDDGPSSVTPHILDLLDAYNAKGTFFILGVQIPGNEGTLQRMVGGGHLIGNHTYNHRQMTELTAEEIQEQLALTDNALEAATGRRTSILRPTYGAYNNATLSATSKPFIFWSVDTNDWRYRDASHVANHILENAYDGSIILMHDIYDTTLEGLRSAIPSLIEQGYQLVTVEELAYLKGYSLESYNVYSGF